jgi:hypothetical protein
MSYAKENMVKIEANNNRGYLVIFLQEFTIFIRDPRHLTKTTNMTRMMNTIVGT